MPITDKQVISRRKHIGSSDAAKVMGLSPWGSAHDVWLEKTGRLEDRTTTSSMTAGRYLEGALLDWFEAENSKIDRNCYRSYPQAHLGVHIDAIVRETGCPVECKSSSGYGKAFYGVAGSDDVPIDVIIQCMVHMICLQDKGKPGTCWVPAVVGDAHNFVLYVVGWNQELADIICDRCTRFWEDHVVTDTAPPDSSPSGMPVLRRIRRLPDRIAEIPLDLLSAWQTINAHKLTANKAEEQAKGMLLNALGDNEAGQAGDQLLTYYHENGNIVTDTKALRRDGLFDQYCTQGTRRVMRVKQKE